MSKLTVASCRYVKGRGLEVAGAYQGNPPVVDSEIYITTPIVGGVTIAHCSGVVICGSSSNMMLSIYFQGLRESDVPTGSVLTW